MRVACESMVVFRNLPIKLKQAFRNFINPCLSLHRLLVRHACCLFLLGPEVVLSLTVNIDCSGSKEDTLKVKLQEDVRKISFKLSI